MKEGALHREWSLWNQLKLNKLNKLNKSNVTDDDVNDTIPVISDTNNDIKYDSPYSYDEKKSSKFRNINKFKFIIYFTIFLSLLFNFHNFLPSKINSCHSINSNDNKPNFSLKNYQSIPMNFHPQSLKNVSSPHEVIDIPFSPYTNNSLPVYSHQLLNHSFGLSWNKPILVKYSPPPSNITYNRVIFSLDTIVDGVQYDRLIHIYLNNNEIWRSSTIEPSGKLSHSYTEKDMTMYSKLFQSEGDLLIQLDNIITPKLTGKFNITISALYFNETEHPIKNISGGRKNRTLADHPDLIPLTPNKYGVQYPPISYYPDSKLSISLPEINLNTTQLMVLLTTSGNAAEEFWYSNLMDQYKDSFLSNNRHFYGHGSCRIINVFINGIRVHSTIPKPYIFTGGIAPTLWNSIVSTGSFNIMPYHIDLTSIIPLLWDSSAELEIEISNCLDDDDKTIVKSSIGSNWITSASLAIWEDENIDNSFGDLNIFDNSTEIKSFAINPPFTGFLTQIIKANYSNILQSNITHVYKNGSEITNLRNYENHSNETSVIIINKFGDNQSLLFASKSNTTINEIDPFSEDILKDFTMLTNSALATSLKFTPPDDEGTMVDPDDISFSTNVSLKIESGAYEHFIPLVEIKSKENGTADFTISKNGNYGTGSMLHNYTLSDITGLKYNRIALAENDTIVYDNITESDSKSTIKTLNHLPCHGNNYLLINELGLNNEEFAELESILSEDELNYLIKALIEN